jgi:lipoprotein-anchoring transpeptidase ErfK/SrfK
MRQIGQKAAAGSGTGWRAVNFRLHAIAAVMVMAAAEAFAQEQAQARGLATRREVVVSIPDRKLALIEDGEVVKVYPVAVGAPVSPSPAGEFTVVNRITNPTYYHKGQVIPTGPANPVGTRWIGLSQKGYGIHGTNQPKSIGKAASHGCIRMAKADLEELFEFLRPGDPVSIRADRDERLAQMFGGGATVTLASNHYTAPSTSAAGGQ